MKRTTIKDLAQLLSLSTSTVSRALSNHPDISESTKARVREAAETFNYTTNLHARLFRKQNSGLIALILPEINMFFSPKLIEGVNKTVASSNYSLITFLSNDSFKREKEIIKQCLNWAVEGVMISLSKETYSLDHLAPFAKAGIKCVLLDKTLEDDKFPIVKIDGEEASYKAIAYLIEKGHSNILGIFGNPNLSITQDRIKGYKKALIANDMRVLNENIISVDKSTELDFILPPVLNHNNNISAIFTMSDELLAKCHYHINALGLFIPQDISVISISDGIYPHLVFPKITHIKSSGSKMGKKACRFLFDIIAKKERYEPTEVFISNKLVVLDSVSY